MAKRTVEWSKIALIDFVEILNYYIKRNKSKTYSQKLNTEIKFKLKTLDFKVALPQKTSVKDLFYFTHNHISVCFEILGNNLKVQLVIDDRRSPELIEKLLNFIE
jgi:hypothetical protein